MKKVLSLLLVLLMVISALSGTATLNVSAESGTTGDCNWSLNGTVLTISGNGAMADYDGWDTVAPWGNGITRVIIESGVTKIGDAAFWECEDLKTVTLNSGLATIGMDAFKGCVRLEKISIPDSVTTIKNSAFYDCGSLKKVELPKNLTVINDYMFFYCYDLVDINIPATVTRIGIDAFYYCTSLKNIALPEGLKVIDEYAFRLCPELENINIPDSVTTIGDYAFMDCESLYNIPLTDNISTIGMDAFCNTAYWNDADNWENGALYINNHLIYVEEGVQSHVIKDGTVALANNAMTYCEQLTELTIPKSVKIIGKDSFYYCEKLETVNYAGSKSDWNKINIKDGNEPLENANIIFGEAASYTPGDIDDSEGVVDLNDIVVLAQALAGWGVSCNNDALDVNGDGINDLNDVVHLARYVAGWEGIVLK